MDHAISASEANRNFSEVLRRVEQGESLSVTRHGRVVARIVPSDASEKAERARRATAMRALLDDLAKRPVLNRGRLTREDGYD